MIEDQHLKNSKKINSLNKPSINAFKFHFQNFFNERAELVWDLLNESNEFNRVLNNVMDEVVTEYANEISRDYIMSLFIAKITSEEYKKNGFKLKDRVIEVLKSDLILTVINSGIKIATKLEVIQPIIRSAIDEIYKTSLHPKELVNSFINEWISKKIT